MMNIIRGYIFRLYPNLEQQQLIEKSFGCSRFIYNYFLNKYPNYINEYNCCKEIKELKIRKWECPNCLSLNERDINASVNIMFEGLKKYKKKDLELQVN